MKTFLKKKSVIAAIAIVSILAVLFSVLLVIYLKDNQEPRNNYLNKEIKIISDNETIGEFSFEELEDYAESVDFEAVYKPNGKLPKEKNYTGIELKELLLNMGVDLENAESVLFKASDGLQKIYSIDDVMQDNNVYIANKVEGEPFNKGILPNSYDKEQEDGGAFVVIKANDAFSQNRVKMLVEIEVVYA